jgi:dihydroflavonol-4-reductase
MAANRASAALEKLLVTGATGQLGNNLVRLLLDRGHRVRVLVRNHGPHPALDGLDIETAVGSVEDAQAVRRAVADTSGVIHAAGCVLLGWRHAELHERANHIGTRNLAEASRQEGVPMVFVSSVNALGVASIEQPGTEEWVAGSNPPCPYVLSKQAGERAIIAEIERGLDAVLVYPGFMLGPWDWKPSSGRMLLEVARRFTPFAPVGGFSVCDARDVSAGVLAAMEKGQTGRKYVLAGHNMSYLDAWNRFANVSGGSRPWCRAGPLMRVIAGQCGDLVARFKQWEPDVNSAAIQMSNRFHCFSSQRARDELGYQVRPADESIQDAWQWFVKYGYA